MSLDPLERVRMALRAAPDDPYWCRRFCEVAASSLDPRHGSRQTELIPDAVRSIARVATHDPEYFTTTNPIELGRLFGLPWLPMAAIDDLESRLKIGRPSLDHHVKGVLWGSAAMYRHTIDQPSAPFHERAVAHLSKVDRAERTESFYESLCDGICGGPFQEIHKSLDDILAMITGYGRSGALVAILEASARHGDWAIYDRCRPKYDEAASKFEHAHADCAVFNFDGLRSLARGDTAGLPALMRKLLNRARNVKFLGTPDTIVLLPELIGRGLCLDECGEYLEMATTPGRPHKSLDKLRQDLDAARARKT